MVFVHGEDFKLGDSQLFPGHILAKKEVLVITFNYRLGALGKKSLNVSSKKQTNKKQKQKVRSLFVSWRRTLSLFFPGFMTTLDANAPGNYGILDVVKVLEFVQNHIRSFRGDPEQVRTDLMTCFVFYVWKWGSICAIIFGGIYGGLLTTNHRFGVVPSAQLVLLQVTLVGAGSGAAIVGILLVSPRSLQYNCEYWVCVGEGGSLWMLLVFLCDCDWLLWSTNNWWIYIGFWSARSSQVEDRCVFRSSLCSLYFAAGTGSGFRVDLFDCHRTINKCGSL